ncbi:MAG: hypothetical protein HYY24_11705 [Verrucomicrobia bacterium]|nr:hypothetical protein [Verrucomicrobiota bacterium]
MSNATNGFEKMRTVAYVVAIVGTFLLMAWLVRTVQRLAGPPPVDVKRIEERKKFRAEADTTGKDALETYFVVDKEKGIYRIPIERALELTVQEWQDPAAARTNLVSRAEKLAEPPPKAPEKPSEFE